MTDARRGLSAAPRLALAHGRVHFWQGGSLWIGRGHGLSDWHDHHAHQIALALDGECRFRSENEGAWAPFDGAIVPSHCLHQFVVQDSTVAHLFIEPETVEGRVLTRRFAAGAIAPLPDEARRSMAAVLLGAHRAREGGAEMVSAAKKALALLTGATMQAVGVDARITKALAYLRARVRTPISLADAACAAALSPSRFRHVFVQETGATFRAYVLWLRLNVAIEARMSGVSWTDAAHEAGFADSSHLTRTFKRMFGINPATLVPQ